MRALIIVVSALTLTGAIAWDTAREQRRADRAAGEACENAAEAQRVADDEVGDAQAEADEKTAAPRPTFAKLREDYRNDTNTKLVKLDKKIVDLDAQATTDAARRANREARLTDIRHSRMVFVNEYRTVETATATTWDDLRKRLDTAWNQLEARVNRAHGQ